MRNMTSMDSGASEHSLINLIYRHLKENGYRKAASALQQQVSQVQTANVKVSLEDIFKKWLSEEREKKTDEGKAPHSGSESNTTNAAHNTKPVKKTLAAARQQKRKRSKTEMCISSIAVKDHKTGDDSDSDSSLDVEKWKRLALELSDADFAKMDAFINFSTSTGKSTKPQKPAQPKKQQSPKTTKVKTATSLTKTHKKKATKKKTFSSSESDKIATPSNKAILAEPNEKSLEIKTTSNLLDRVATPMTAVSNKLSESDGTNFKHTKKLSLSKSHSMETTTKTAEIEKAEPASKKTKSKKNLTTPVRFETSCKVTDAEFAIQTFQCGLDSVLHSKTGETKAKKDASKKATPVGVDTFIQTGTEDATDSLSSDQLKINPVADFIPAETSSKRAKSKKSKRSKELQEPGDVAMPSGECEIEVDYNHSNQHQTQVMPVSVKKAVAEPEAVEKRSKKSKKSLMEPNGRENPTTNLEIQVTTSILESLSSETSSKKSKTKKASEAHRLDSPSKQAVVDVGDGGAAENSSSQLDQTVNCFKKSKRKRAASCGDHETSSVTDHVPKGQYNSLIPAGHGTKQQDQECALAINAEGTPEPKKRKKHKKDKEKKKNESDENVEELQPTPPAEEFTDSWASSQKKKKKKKEKHREEEVPFVSTPAPEEYAPKKKKKSSKKKEHVEVSEQESI